MKTDNMVINLIFATLLIAAYISALMVMPMLVVKTEVIN
jgi:phage shock protein PspC (stress-responsive transcriptional regulator)